MKIVFNLRFSIENYSLKFKFEMVIIVSFHSCGLKLFGSLFFFSLIGWERIAVKINWNIFHVQKEKKKKWANFLRMIDFFLLSPSLFISLCVTQCCSICARNHWKFFWVPWLMVFLSSLELRLVQSYSNERKKKKKKPTRTDFISIRLYCARILTHKVIRPEDNLWCMS